MHRRSLGQWHEAGRLSASGILITMKQRVYVETSVISYLASRHLANASLRVQIAVLLEDAGFACPVICTPEELMEG